MGHEDAKDTHGRSFGIAGRKAGPGRTERTGQDACAMKKGGTVQVVFAVPKKDRRGKDRAVWKDVICSRMAPGDGT